MVSSSSITGSLIDGRLFDQSIVGIFPHDKYKNLTYFLLGFFNSSVCNDLIRTINASTNNSSNYIKKIPLIIPDTKMLKIITNEVEFLVSKSKKENISDKDLVKLNDYFEEIYSVKSV